MSNEKSGAPHFVWWCGHRGPEPQKWMELDYGVGAWKTPFVLAAHPITADQYRTMSVNSLAERFPAPIMESVE